MVISIGCDHAGFPIKGEIVAWLQSQGHTVVEHGCFDENPVDFPVIAREVCQTVLDGKAERGIMICGTGVGAAIACNKIPGIRASCCHDIYSAHQCVEHGRCERGLRGQLYCGQGERQGTAVAVSERDLQHFAGVPAPRGHAFANGRFAGRWNEGGRDMITVRDKFYGCILGAHIGSAMGAAVEGWTWQQIEEKYGLLTTLEPHVCYDNGWMRLPGTTEDGIERQKLMITAMIEKQGRVNAEDVRAAWLKHIKPEAPGMVSEKFEATLLGMARSGIPARDLGRYCDYAGLNAFSRACHPLGLINAGDIAGARDDVFEVGQLYQTTNSRGLQWAVTTAGGHCGGNPPCRHAGQCAGRHS